MVNLEKLVESPKLEVENLEASLTKDKDRMAKASQDAEYFTSKHRELETLASDAIAALSVLVGSIEYLYDLEQAFAKARINLATRRSQDLAGQKEGCAKASEQMQLQFSKLSTALSKLTPEGQQACPALLVLLHLLMIHAL